MYFGSEMGGRQNKITHNGVITLAVSGTGTENLSQNNGGQ